jgi:hypothetical protein
VSVARVDIDRRELDFRLVARHKRPARVGKPEKSSDAHPPRSKSRKRSADGNGEQVSRKRSKRRR